MIIAGEKKGKKEKELPKSVPGDKIITNSNCSLGKGHTGIVLTELYDYYGVYFDNPSNIKEKNPKAKLGKLIRPDYVDDKVKKYFLKKEEGLFVDRKEFDIVPKENPLLDYFFKNKFQELTNKLNAEKTLNEMVIRDKNDIKRREKDIKISKKKLIDSEKELKSLEFVDFKSIQIEDCTRDYEILQKHSKIDSIEITPRYFVVKTIPLEYHNKKYNLDYKDFGGYYIFIPLEEGGAVKAINYKKQILKGGYHHPCIERGGIICTGAYIREELNKFLKEKNILGIVTTLIDFLEEPNYGTPHMDDWKFDCAQPVTLRPSNVEDWLSSAYWDTHQKFNNAKWNRDTKEAKIKFQQKVGITSSPPDEEEEEEEENW